LPLLALCLRHRVLRSDSLHVFYGLDWVATVPPTSSWRASSFWVSKFAIVYGWIFCAHQLGAGPPIALRPRRRAHPSLVTTKLAFMTLDCYACRCRTRASHRAHSPAEACRRGRGARPTPELWAGDSVVVGLAVALLFNPVSAAAHALLLFAGRLAPMRFPLQGRRRRSPSLHRTRHPPRWNGIKVVQPERASVPRRPASWPDTDGVHRPPERSGHLCRDLQVFAADTNPSRALYILGRLAPTQPVTPLVSGGEIGRAPPLRVRASQAPRPLDAILFGWGLTFGVIIYAHDTAPSLASAARCSAVSPVVFG